MKTVRNLFVVALMLVTITNMASPRLSVNVLMMGYDVFYFKVDKEWIGGEVDIVGADAKQISAQKLDKKKMMIDFFDLAPGTYTIIIKKNDNCDYSEEFTYIKK